MFRKGMGGNCTLKGRI